MTKVSAGLLAYRRTPLGVQFLLAHPGGPFWRNREEGAWSIPKGAPQPGEDPMAAALREFEEEVGLTVSGPLISLAPCRQPGGTRVAAWLVEADLDLSAARFGTFEMEWPPRSGRRRAFPEIDAVRYMSPAEARTRILPGQRPLLRDAIRKLGAPRGD